MKSAAASNKTTRDLFEPRQAPFPEEYDFSAFKDGIRQSYWVHDEFNFEGDIQDYHAECSPTEQAVIERAMLAISQIEVSVKKFWGTTLPRRVRKPEVHDIGASFGESEVRHKDAYAHLLRRLGLGQRFADLEGVEAIQRRIDYLSEHKRHATADAGEASDRQFIETLMLFSIFIEHVSLFSQFLILTAFDKHTKRFRGIANAVEATSKEEQLHSLYGAELVRICRDERPEWFEGGRMEARAHAACKDAFEGERAVLGWIYGEGDLGFLPRKTAEVFVKDRFNDGLSKLGFSEVFSFTEEERKRLRAVEWFEEDRLMTKDNDFFSKRSTTYTKNNATVTADTIFGPEDGAGLLPPEEGY